MIKKNKESFTIRCDKCGFEEDIDTHGDIEVFKIIIAENGWKSLHSYKNICEDCGGLKK
jgi:ribosomal protein L37E